jgi:cyclophilin family peptidyl-prolyl cis-trans isomerase
LLTVQQPLLDADGNVHPWLNITDRQQFEQRILTPLYREMDITGREVLADRSDEVTRRLQDSTVADVYRRRGYRYDGALPSRPPRIGSLLLLSVTPERSSATIAVTLTDARWLRGQHTVIGQVVDGMPVVRALGSQPRRGTPPATIYRIETETEENGS